MIGQLLARPVASSNDAVVIDAVVIGEYPVAPRAPGFVTPPPDTDALAPR